MKIAVNAIILFFVLVSTSVFPSCKEKRGELKTIWYNGSYNRDFNDLNDVQLAVAQKIGIDPSVTVKMPNMLPKRCRRSKPAIIMKWKN